MKTQLEIEGMVCDMCVQHAKRALQRTPGVNTVEIDLQAQRAVVEGDDFDPAQLIAAVAEEGYQAKVTSWE